MGLKIIRYILVLVVLFTIVFLSMQSVQDTVGISEWFRSRMVALCDRTGFNSIRGWIDSPINIRRLGHVIEFFALGLVTAIASKKMWKAWALCICMSLFDQILKIYVPGRHFDPVDLGFDAAGYAIGICIVWIMKMRLLNNNTGRE